MFILFSDDQDWAIMICIYLSINTIYVPRYLKLLTCFIQSHVSAHHVYIVNQIISIRHIYIYIYIIHELINRTK